MSDYILNLLPLNDEERAAFEKAAPQAVHVYAGRRTATPEQYEKATVILGWPRPRDLAACKNLRWLQSMWAGTDEYVNAGTLPPDAVLTNSSGANSQSVAEHMLACLLALCRKLPESRDYQNEGRWVDTGKMKSITGARVLVVGAGHVGGCFASMCKALGAHTVGLKRTVTGPVPGFEELDTMDHLDEQLRLADVVALCLPANGATAGLMDDRRLNMMKADAILLNAGRGSVIDHQALMETMRTGHLWGAAIDVTDPEPLPDHHPLWSTPRLLITPHVAGGMRLEATRKNCVNMAYENLVRYVAGEPLKNQVKR